MRFMKLLSWIAALVITAGCAAETPASDDTAEILAAYPELQGKAHVREIVTRIIDGDTFELASGHKVRLIGVNTPEITKGKSEAYGEEAKQYASDHLLDQEVILFADVSDTDRYGRLLRYVFLPGDPLMFNERLLLEGYANTMTVPPDVTFAERFVAREQEARAAGAGLWSDAAAASAGSAPKPQETQDSVNSYEPSCEDPQIKGNINSKGERIYHEPGSRYYDATIPELMFCTAEEAEAAGFRAPKR
ncbi:hypothetical protein PRECH8_11130 [Insulibacter thermoxylanivorax]|uniref:TNase-like domain-containing protein n=2 Tax=Insulibacter thermoxylanivorax TaxID=2749268 RepID=A0A916QBS1_9BACL|nr:hypothetical protein PRECH8_11130 [Insulibacter thermoxylanivorax]